MENINKTRIEQLLQSANPIIYTVNNWVLSENQLILSLQREIVHRFWFTDHLEFMLFQEIPILKAQWLCGNGWVTVNVRKRVLAKAIPQTFDPEFIYRNNELIIGNMDDGIFLSEADVIFLLKSIKILNTSFHFSNEIEVNSLLKNFHLNQLY